MEHGLRTVAGMQQAGEEKGNTGGGRTENEKDVGGGRKVREGERVTLEAAWHIHTVKKKTSCFNCALCHFWKYRAFNKYSPP